MPSAAKRKAPRMNPRGLIRSELTVLRLLGLPGAFLWCGSLLQARHFGILEDQHEWILHKAVGDTRELQHIAHLNRGGDWFFESQGRVGLGGIENAENDLGWFLGRVQRDDRSLEILD